MNAVWVFMCSVITYPMASNHVRVLLLYIRSTVLTSILSFNITYLLLPNLLCVEQWFAFMRLTALAIAHSSRHR
ncbi:hypothetical protein V8C34DRAFT_287460 [Trichoderma compactum]